MYRFAFMDFAWVICVFLFFLMKWHIAFFRLYYKLKEFNTSKKQRAHDAISTTPRFQLSAVIF